MLPLIQTSNGYVVEFAVRKPVEKAAGPGCSNDVDTFHVELCLRMFSKPPPTSELNAQLHVTTRWPHNVHCRALHSNPQ